MKLSECKVGDRVCVYAFSKYHGTIDTVGETLVRVTDDTYKKSTALYPQQLRRLKPRRKAREFYIAQVDSMCCCEASGCADRMESKCIRVKEIL